MNGDLTVRPLVTAPASCDRCDCDHPDNGNVTGVNRSDVRNLGNSGRDQNATFFVPFRSLRDKSILSVGDFPLSLLKRIISV